MEKSLVFGGRCSELLAIYDQDSQSWRMSQLSLFEEAERYLEALPASGMMQNGQLYQLDNLEHPILDVDGFVLPTPTTDQRVKRYKQGGRSTLCAIMELLPTPSASEHKYRLKGNTQGSKNLEAKARTGYFGKKGKLHPLFVVWMMGFPKEWLS